LQPRHSVTRAAEDAGEARTIIAGRMPPLPDSGCSAPAARRLLAARFAGSLE
jgi:hypothetical protein